MSSSVARLEAREARRRSASVDRQYMRATGPTSVFEDIVGKAYQPARSLARSSSSLCVGNYEFGSKYLPVRTESFYSTNPFMANAITPSVIGPPIHKYSHMYQTPITTWTYPIWKYLHTSTPISKPTSSDLKLLPSRYRSYDPYAKTYNQYMTRRSYKTYLAGEINYYKEATDRALNNYRSWRFTVLPDSSWFNDYSWRWCTPYSPPNTARYISSIRLR